MSAFSTILHKRNATAGVVPSPSSLSAGEIAINTADGKLFTKTDNNTVETFLNANNQPYILNSSLSSIETRYGSNSATEILAVVLGGINNEITGAGSTIINGSNNVVSGDYAAIINGSTNVITSAGDFGAILGGQNNTLDHQESFILGSNITSHLSGFTYANNLSATNIIYGSGGEFSGNVEVSNYFAAGSGVATSLYVENFRVGINTETPNVALTVVGSISSTNTIYTKEDVEITDPTRGIILTSPDNSKWRITISNSGTLSVAAL